MFNAIHLTFSISIGVEQSSEIISTNVIEESNSPNSNDDNQKEVDEVDIPEPLLQHGNKYLNRTLYQ